jgi:hypothetical protein
VGRFEPVKGRLAAAVLVVLTASAPASAAEGGTSIASAPLVQWGAQEDGIGAHDIPGGGSSGTDFGHAFWRVRVFAGDRVTGTGSEGMAGLCLDSMWLYSPSVTDASLQRSKPTFETAVKHAGPSCDSHGYRWSWRNVPWTGVATIWANFAYQQTFEFVVRDAHRTRTRFQSVPQRIPSAGVSTAMSASVTSAAGKPNGRCAFDRQQRGRSWREVRRVTLRRGLCAAALEAGTTTSVRFRVRFLPGRGWLPSSATTPRLSVG